MLICLAEGLTGGAARVRAINWGLEPAIGLLAGLLVLGQIRGAAATVGILFVVNTGIGASRTGAGKRLQSPRIAKPLVSTLRILWRKTCYKSGFG